MGIMMRDYRLYVMTCERKTQQRIFTDMDESYIGEKYVVEEYTWRIVAPSQWVARAQHDVYHRYSFIGEEGYSRIKSVAEERIDCVMLSYTH